MPKSLQKSSAVAMRQGDAKAIGHSPYSVYRADNIAKLRWMKR
jgi:hypothetical protein